MANPQDKFSALAAALNSAQSRPPQDVMNSSPFLIQQNQLLEQEKAREQQLVQQRMQQEQMPMMQPQIGQPPVVPQSMQNPGESAQGFLTRLSLGSPRGQAQWKKKSDDDMALALEIQRLKEQP